MDNSQRTISSLFERSLPWLVLALIFLYTYMTFVQIPYIGFDFNPSNGEVGVIFTNNLSGENLQLGDLILKVDELPWSVYRTDSRLVLFSEVITNQIVLLHIQRGDQKIVIPWAIPGFNYRELLDRIFNVWILAYVFWIAGTATLLLVRPKGTRWRLQIAFYFLTSFWLITGSMSRWHTWDAAILFRMAIWLWVPVCLHLHWIFPKPLKNIPKPLLWAFYLFAVGLSIAEWFQILPRNSYPLGFLLAVFGSVIFLVLHYKYQPNQRWEIGLLAAAIILAILPSFILNITILVKITPMAGGLLLFVLPIIPIAYFYIIYRRQLGGFEVRANQLISSYIFIILIGSGVILIFSLISTWSDFPSILILAGLMSAILVGLITIYGYPSFNRFVEHRLLGMPVAPAHLVEDFSARITTSLATSSLVKILQDEILPSLLIKQSTLLTLKDNDQLNPLYTNALNSEQLPSRLDEFNILDKAGQYLPSASDAELPPPMNWVRLLFPLTVKDELLGFWLLGQRDPDDFYSQAEISILQTISNQTSIALANITQAERLHALYQANIELQEQERTELARDLHDDILNQLALLAINVDQSLLPNFSQHYTEVTSSIRQMISGLRPAMLNYGLWAAFDELTDELNARVASNVEILYEIPSSESRYTSRAEEHLYRIVQQACENAIRHSQANHIFIRGNLDQDKVTLNVVDDGLGFHDPDQYSFEKLLEKKRFGMAGMYERAGIIGAQLSIDTEPDKGTTLTVQWRQIYRPSAI